MVDFSAILAGCTCTDLSKRNEHYLGCAKRTNSALTRRGGHICVEGSRYKF